MFDWIKQNIGSIAVLLVVITIIALIVVFRKKAKKKGKSTCGCNCSSCAGRFACHNYKQEEIEK
ncbi:MAG: FeoB-associated Cys-rich membrane protein [Clostridia bacterium]|nr:FeoB-associated Cys-rich membrane protein [Clostridia bacterium]